MWGIMMINNADLNKELQQMNKAYRKAKRGYKGKKSKARLLAGVLLMLAMAVVTLFPTSRSLEGDFEAVFLDVGQGDSVLICADGYTILVDAGGLPGDSTQMAENVVIPYIKSLGITKVDMVFNTHPDNDHIGGLFAVLDEMQVDKLALFDGYVDNKKHNQLLSLAEEKNVPIAYVADGDEFKLSENFSIEVMSPDSGETFGKDKVNNGSLVLHFSYDDFDLLTTGDLVGGEMDTAIDRLDCRDIEVLQLPHHGSKNSYDEDWYAEFDPMAVVISCGLDNDYGHPGKDVVNYWEQEGAEILRTDYQGSCKIIYKNGEVDFETAA